MCVCVCIYIYICILRESVCVCVCVCVCIYIYIYIYTHTHTHSHIYTERDLKDYVYILHILVNYLQKCNHKDICIYPTSPQWAGCDRMSVFKCCTNGLNSEFSFSYTCCQYLSVGHILDFLSVHLRLLCTRKLLFMHR